MKHTYNQHPLVGSEGCGHKWSHGANPKAYNALPFIQHHTSPMNW